MKLERKLIWLLQQLVLSLLRIYGDKLLILLEFQE
jgi:hypothetical protein